MSKKLFIPLVLKRLLRNLPYNNTEEIGINRFGTEMDLVYVRQNVPKHTDSDGSDSEKDVLLACLINDGDKVFGHEGMENEYTTLTSGKIIRFDGSKPHSLYNVQDNGLETSAFIIWDVPKDKPTASFLYDLQDRVYELIEELAS